MESLVKAQLDNRKQEPLLKAHSTGWAPRIFVVGTAVVTVYTLGFTAPFITIPVLAIAVLFGAQEMKNVQDPRTAEKLNLLLNSGTPRHPTIRESQKALRKLFHTRDLNAALQQMADCCEWIVVKPDSEHSLRGFGEVYAYVDPIDSEISMPIEGLFKLLKRWGVEPAVDAETKTVDAAATSDAPALEPTDTPPMPPEVQALAEEATTLSGAAAALGVAPPVASDDEDYPDYWTTATAETTAPQADPLAELWIGDSPNPALLKLPIKERGTLIVQRLIADGFAIDKVMAGSVIVVAGNQRGGKGTLLALLCILQQALTEGETAIRYYTAGTDIYPFKTLKTVCADSFPSETDKDEANRLVAKAMAEELEEYRKFENYEKRGEMLVIDEAIALAEVSSPDTNREQASYLLRQFAKSGATVIIVLHASNLTAWVGSGNTGGLAQAFNSGVSLIGCRSKAIATTGLQATNVATGEYFFADPKNFGEPMKHTPELGKIPDWLLKVKHPGNGAPDPARSLLAFFPEMVSASVLSLEPERFQRRREEGQPVQTTQQADTYTAKETDLQLDLEKAFEFIKHQLPFVGSCLTVRGLYRCAGASALGINQENAEDLIRQLAEAESQLFKVGEKTFNTQKTSKYIERINHQFPPLKNSDFR